MHDPQVINSFLQRQLTQCSHYLLNPLESDQIHSHGIQNFIYQSLTSPKYRKWNLDPELQDKIRQSVFLCTSKSSPINLVLPFGGFKLWHYPIYAEVSWSEFFSLSYFITYISPIFASYLPGVTLTIVSDDSIIDSLNSIPKIDIDKYFLSFQELISLFTATTPPNLRIELSRLQQQTNSLENWYSQFSHRQNPSSVLISCTPIPDSIAIGSTQDSSTMFWSSMAVVENRAEGLTPRLITPDVWNQIIGLPHQEIPVSIVNLPNFRKINIFPLKFGLGQYHWH